MKNLIFMEPVYKDYIWGGNNLKEKLKKNTPYEKTAESWEISSNNNGDCKILNKEFDGKKLSDLFNNCKLKEEIFGTSCEDMKEFPLLIKFIDAKDNLSIQVHPDDNYANNVLKEPYGKNEMWYIMECEENSKIIGGITESLTKKELKSVVENNKIKDYLNYLNVKKGDSIYIPAGTIHAILKNNLICEIQQNSNITYRVYDWDRVDKNGIGRELHKNEAIDTIKTDIIPKIIHQDTNNNLQTIADNQYFKVDKINCTEKFSDKTISKSFYAINVVAGSGKIKTTCEEILIKKGDSFLIPASLGKYEVFGTIEFLRTHVSF